MVIKDGRAPLPQLMCSAHGLTAVYLRSVLVELAATLLNSDSADIDLPSIVNPILQAHAIDARRLMEDNFYRIPIYKIFKLIESLEMMFADPLLGIKAIDQIRVKSFPILGYAVMSSETLLDAIQRLSRYEPLIWDVGHVRLESGEDSQGEFVSLIWEEKIPTPATAVEMAIAGWIKIGSQLLPAGHQPQVVEFKHACRTQGLGSQGLGSQGLCSPQAYEPYLQCPVRFDQQYNRIVFPKQWLNQPLLDQDPHLSELMKIEADKLLSNIPLGLNLENELRALLFCQLDNPEISLGDAALHLQVTPRFLRQAMSERHLQFRQLHDDVRQEAAIYLLQQGHDSLADLSQLLGFSEQSAFTRAFKRWTGQTPASFGSAAP